MLLLRSVVVVVVVVVVAVVVVVVVVVSLVFGGVGVVPWLVTEMSWVPPGLNGDGFIMQTGGGEGGTVKK